MLTKTPSSPSQAHLIGLEEELENIKLEEWKEKEEEAKQAPITDDELERFRREWREEVLAKRAGGHDARARGDRSNLASGPKSTDLNSSDPASKSKPFEPILSISTSPIKSAVKSPPPIRRPLSVDVKTSTAGPSRAQIVPPPGKIGKIPFRNPRVQDKDRAVQLYGRAVESEQSGKLNDALMLYRKAFKLDGECFFQTSAFQRSDVMRQMEWIERMLEVKLPWLQKSRKLRTMWSPLHHHLPMSYRQLRLSTSRTRSNDISKSIQIMSGQLSRPWAWNPKLQLKTPLCIDIHH